MLNQRTASSKPSRTSRRATSRKKTSLAATGGSSAIRCQNCIISAGVFPAAISAALIAPADVPDSTAGPAANRGSASSRS